MVFEGVSRKGANGARISICWTYKPARMVRALEKARTEGMARAREIGRTAGARGVRVAEEARS